jgi:hypothetical protein
MASVDATDAWMTTRNAEECAFFDAMTHCARPRAITRARRSARNEMLFRCRRTMAGHEMLDRRSADLLHDGVRLDAQQFERTLDAWLPEGAEAPGKGRPTHTAVAPMHSALTTSVPRRKPESTRIGMRPLPLRLFPAASPE